MNIYMCCICKKSLSEVQYVLPVWFHARGGVGDKVFYPKLRIESKKVNLCSNCEKTIADFIDDSRNNKEEETKNEI